MDKTQRKTEVAVMLFAVVATAACIGSASQLTGLLHVVAWALAGLFGFTAVVAARNVVVSLGGGR